MAKKLYRSRKNAVICGVCGGIAEYFNIDASIVRIIWVLLSLSGGTGLLIYIIAAFILDDAPAEDTQEHFYPDNNNHN